MKIYNKNKITNHILALPTKLSYFLPLTSYFKNLSYFLPLTSYFKNLSYFLLLTSYLILYTSYFLLASGCANTNFSPRSISHMTQVDSLLINHKFDKVSYHPIDKTFFCLSKNENSVYIYKNDTFFNKIGGSGFSMQNFRNITDITVGVDGILYALDSFERTIKRFDRDGKFQNQVSISQINSPTFFSFSNFGFIFVYDSHAKEIHSLDSFDFSTKFSFGKFQINQIHNLFVFGDYLNIFDSNQNQTLIFQINGRFLNNHSGFTFGDLYKNILKFDNKKILDTRTENILFVTEKKNNLNIENDNFILFNEGCIKVFRLIYKENL